MPYAEDTSVPVERSKAEMEKTLKRYGASGFMYGWKHNADGGENHLVAFEVSGRRIQFRLPLPTMDSDLFRLTPGGKKRAPSEQESAYDKEVRRRWRALLLVIKAKLEAIESGISTLDEEFMAWFVLPGGETVGERMRPMIDHALATGDLPPLLPGPVGE